LTKRQEVSQGSPVTTYRRRADLSCVRPALQIFQETPDQLDVAEPLMPWLPGCLKVQQFFLDLSGTGDGLNQIPVDPVGPVGLSRGIPPLQDIVIIAEIKTLLADPDK
jgi:hypothetical protein